jgi:hypothetical protein
MRNPAMRMSPMVSAIGAFLLPLLLSTASFAAAAGKNNIGPSLAGIVGRPSGSIPGFKYSPANLAANVTWTSRCWTSISSTRKP